MIWLNRRQPRGQRHINFNGVDDEDRNGAHECERWPRVHDDDNANPKHSTYRAGGHADDVLGHVDANGRG